VAATDNRAGGQTLGGEVGGKGGGGGRKTGIKKKNIHLLYVLKKRRRCEARNNMGNSILQKGKIRVEERLESLSNS